MEIREMKIKNPDYPNPVYHVWHFCTECERAYTNSQGSFEVMKRTKCCVDNLKSFSTDFSGVDLPDREVA